MIQQEINNTTVSQFSEKQLDYVFNFIIHGTSRIIQMWINKDDREPSDEIATLLTQLMQI